jgi:ABC-type glycerol-3-phosphate transport system permease component
LLCLRLNNSTLALTTARSPREWEIIVRHAVRLALPAIAAFVSMAIPLLVFFALQRCFVRGLTAGAVKG